MNTKLIAAAGVIALALSGCASVPMATEAEDAAAKTFAPPPADKAGLYIYRNSSLGGALKKTVYVDGEVIGETGPKTYFYTLVEPGERKLSTESEFGENDLVLQAEAGKNHYVRQYIKLGVIVGGANLELVDDEKGQAGVRSCKRAQ
ncbi:MAG: DUF2846 domain-containing protein [Pseudomonadota bacterium]